MQKSKFDEAITEFQRRLDPSKGKADPALASLACAYAKSGSREEAVRILNDFTEVSKTQFVPPGSMIYVHLALGEREEALQLMEKAYDSRHYEALFWSIRNDPIYDDIRSDPRFISLIGKLGLDN